MDEEALFRALQSGHLSGAALDVMQEEFPEKNKSFSYIINALIVIRL